MIMPAYLVLYILIFWGVGFCDEDANSLYSTPPLSLDWLVLSVLRGLFQEYPCQVFQVYSSEISQVVARVDRVVQ